MATFVYGGTTYQLPNGIFLCSTTATSGGTQSNGLLLQYRGTRTVKPYRDAVVFQALGRTKPAVEVGSYNFQGLDFQFAWPDPTKDYDGVSVDGGDTSGTSGGLNGRDGLERRIKNINAALQAGQYVEYFDARARHLIGTWVQDPQISDIEVGWRQVSASLVEVG